MALVGPGRPSGSAVAGRAERRRHLRGRVFLQFVDDPRLRVAEAADEARVCWTVVICWHRAKPQLDAGGGRLNRRTRVPVARPRVRRVLDPARRARHAQVVACVVAAAASRRRRGGVAALSRRRRGGVAALSRRRRGVVAAASRRGAPPPGLVRPRRREFRFPRRSVAEREAGLDGRHACREPEPVVLVRAPPRGFVRRLLLGPAILAVRGLAVRPPNRFEPERVVETRRADAHGVVQRAAMGFLVLRRSAAARGVRKVDAREDDVRQKEARAGPRGAHLQVVPARRVRRGSISRPRATATPASPPRAAERAAPASRRVQPKRCVVRVAHSVLEGVRDEISTLGGRTRGAAACSRSTTRSTTRSACARPRGRPPRPPGTTSRGSSWTGYMRRPRPP